jgi:hypothetical protein
MCRNIDKFLDTPSLTDFAVPITFSFTVSVRDSKLLFKMFSEGKSPIEVAIQLDLAADRVRAIYREYWELTGRYKLAQIYDEAEYDLHGLLRLHRIFKDLGMGEHDIHNVLELARNNQLQYLQWKVEYLRNDVEMLEIQKAKATNDILKLNRVMDDFQPSLPQKRGEMTYVNDGSGQYDKTDNLYSMTYSEPSSYSIRLSYTAMNDYCGQ